MKNRYLNPSAVLKFATTQNEPNEPKQSNANPEPAIAIHDQFFLTLPTIRQV